MSRPSFDPVQRPSSFPWPPALLAAHLLAAWIAGRYGPIPWTGEGDLAERAGGMILTVVSVAIFVWSAATLKHHGTTILPDKGANCLVTDGPYRYRRNPIYTAHILFLVALAILMHNLWFALAAVSYAILVTWLAILPEERHLEARFGDDYLAYKVATRRW